MARFSGDRRRDCNPRMDAKNLGVRINTFNGRIIRPFLMSRRPHLLDSDVIVCLVFSRVSRSVPVPNSSASGGGYKDVYCIPALGLSITRKSVAI